LDSYVTNVLRILHLQSGGGISGGIAGYIASLVGAEALRGFDFIVAVNPGETAELCQSLKYGNAPIVEVPLSYGFRDVWRVLHYMHRLLRKERVSLVHSHALRSGFICAVLNLLVGTSFVHTNHGLRFHQKSGRLSPLVFRLLERFVVSRADRVFCIRPSDAVLLHSAMSRYSHKIETIVSRINPIDVPEAKLISKPPRPPTLIGIGSLIEIKRVDRFIDWLAALTSADVQYRAIWLGDGPLRPILEERAKNSGASISWRGHVDAATVAYELAHADVMLLTSEFEVMSLAALEAMAKSIPIITTDFFGVRDFVIDQLTGFVLPSDVSPSKAAEKIANLLTDDVLRMAMGDHALTIFAGSFANSDRMAWAYAQAYRNVMEAS
jgi:glycosyltransferase involved in cell wall biosynthesis